MESLARVSGRTLVRAEYGYPKGSPNTNSFFYLIIAFLQSTQDT
jgi:hypothetical protein